VYQWYFGWYDGNPSHLDPLPPVDAAIRYVDAMGGTGAVLAKAQEAFDAGEYRWVSTLLDHLVFAEPENGDARALLARAYDQLGYQAESAPWRDVYLSAAYELRHGAPPADAPSPLDGMAGTLSYVPVSRFLDAMATRLNGPAAEGADVTLNLVFTNLGESHVLAIENSVLHHWAREPDPEAAATVRLTHGFFLRLLLRQASLREMVFSDQLQVEGSRLELLGFFSLFDAIEPNFPIVTP
jgi:alkyl sulfatase BDS1-like metallo-beta-lactamase superfamily hydrolase